MRRWYTARVRGVSMEPTLREGDLLLVECARRAPRRGTLVVVDLPGRGLAVKRLGRGTGEGLWVERDNPRAGTDSWLVGALPWSAARGAVRARVWPRPRAFARLWEDVRRHDSHRR